ncbi:TPA: tyrosine-type recombinase/integrase [Escherichia coli]|nr:integrase arm-type DNA-binding domain-containing protein [Escherichia coli]HCY3389576.1 integrase arm-type DNA-binding domain-containing protein [Escherichia coli]
MALTDAKIRAAKPTDKAYKLTDGAGMFLLVHPNGSRYWRLRYRILGKEKTLALGVYPEVSLSEARTKRDEARKLISEGVDPCEQKRAKKVVPDLQLSFEHIARRWHASNKQWAQSHSDKVLKSLETHVFPFIGNRDITTLSTPELLIPVRAAEAKQIYEIASRLQQRISAVMRYAVQSGIIRYNPALDMAGALTTVKRQHRPALDLSRLPELLSRIDGYKGQPVTRLAVMLNLLVFIRSSELRYARWSEIDIDNAMWTIPAEREPLPGVKFSYRGSKMRTPHLVPLSQQAVAILAELQTWAGENGLIFTGAHDPRKPIIESGLWSRDAVERQMSHQERNGVRAAYIHKAEHLEERRLMLQWWADFLDANREQCISPFEYAKINNPLK